MRWGQQVPAFLTAACQSCQHIRLGMTVTITGVTGAEACGSLKCGEGCSGSKMAIAVMSFPWPARAGS